MAGYVIMVGNAQPGKALVGYPDNSRNSPNKKYVGALKPGTDPLERRISVGKYMLINNYRAWARRVVDGKPLKNDKGNNVQLEFNDPRYKGEIEFLEWGAEGGYAIECRYLVQSTALDVEYQDNIQKIKIDKDKGPAQIELDTGRNEFDYKKQALFIKHLKNHPQNQNSKSKNPNPEIKGHTFYELTDDQVDTATIDSIESGLEAGTIVKEMSSKPQKVRNLFEVIGKREEFGEITEFSNYKEIYTVLLKFSQTNPPAFFSYVNGFKEQIADAFKKAESYNALDLTKDGHIAIEIGGKKEVLLSGLKGKGKDMIQWVIDNYVDEDAYKAIKQLQTAVSKLK